MCEAAARTLSQLDLIATDVLNQNMPEGCFISEGRQLFMGVGIATKGSTASSNFRQLCTSLKPQFQEVNSGSCTDNGLAPITLETACDSARIALGISGPIRQTEVRGVPEGCFAVGDNQVFFGVNPADKGNGPVLTSQGNSLTPICMEFVTQGQAPAPSLRKTTTTLALAPNRPEDATKPEDLEEPVSGALHVCHAPQPILVFIVLWCVRMLVLSGMETP